MTKKVLDYTDSPWNYQGEITHLQKEQVTHALVEYIIAKQHTQISPHLCVFVCVCVCLPFFPMCSWKALRK